MPAAEETTATCAALDNVKAGDVIRCTVSTAPRAKAPGDTIARLMRRDPTNIRALRRAQMLRARRMHRYIRGNRLYTSREKPARVVRVVPGATWQMTFTPDIDADIRSVAAYLTVDRA